MTVYCRNSEKHVDSSNWASATIDVLRRKVENLEEENVDLKVVLTFSFYNIIYKQIYK